MQVITKDYGIQSSHLEAPYNYEVTPTFTRTIPAVSAFVGFRGTKHRASDVCKDIQEQQDINDADYKAEYGG